MRHKKANNPIPEISAVLRASPSLEPCPKFRKARLARFLAHLNEGKCEKCLAFVRQAEKELEMMRFLKGSRN